ncbi:hypothetical protein BDQ17DRAFT_1331230 [Cyathus striatus]|nr:hypothetical protein BDQ17DRAFT_1331230 [Cyathus striatus]
MSENPVNQDHHNLRSTVMQIWEVDTVMNELRIIDMDDPMGLDLNPLAGLVPGAYLTNSTIPPPILTPVLVLNPQAHLHYNAQEKPPAPPIPQLYKHNVCTPAHHGARYFLISALMVPSSSRELAISSWHRYSESTTGRAIITCHYYCDCRERGHNSASQIEHDDIALNNCRLLDQEVMISTLKEKLAAAEVEKKVILEQHNSTVQELRLQLETAMAKRKGQDTRIEGLERSLQQLHAMIENKMAEKQQVAAEARHLELEQHSIASTLQINPLQRTRVQQEWINGGDVEMADDEDEGGEVRTHGRTYGKGKGKGVMELNEDENTTNDPTVPPPMRFKHPKGGAGSRWGTHRERVPSKRPSPAPHASLGTEDTARDSSNGPTLQVLLDEMRDLKAQMSQGTRPTCARPLKLLPKFKLPPKRTYDLDRTELLSCDL